MCARWADDVAVADDDPDMAGLINRGADNWRPLFAIADTIGADWPARARAAAAALAQRESESHEITLLADIKIIFDERAVDRMASADLADTLSTMEGHPWADWKGKPLTANRLAQLLRRFRVIPETHRMGQRTAKGYLRSQFEPLWGRYPGASASPGGYETSQSNNADEMGTSCLFQTVTRNSDVTFQKREKPAPDGHCYDVTVQRPVLTGADGDSGRACNQCGDRAGTRECWVGGVAVWLHPKCQDAWLACEVPPALSRARLSQVPGYEREVKGNSRRPV
jgi:Protein of unknown function (DUF3631)